MRFFPFYLVTDQQDQGEESDKPLDLASKNSSAPPAAGRPKEFGYYIEEKNRDNNQRAEEKAQRVPPITLRKHLTLSERFGALEEQSGLKRRDPKDVSRDLRDIKRLRRERLHSWLLEDLESIWEINLDTSLKDFLQ